MTEQSNFPISIKTITDMADYYDGKNKPKLAKKLTAVARNLVNIKTAQFVGGGGYWIRNTRCWDNCYRQKRATDTTKTAQEVWTACHEEYLESINDSESGWEKYAENIGTFKFAGKNMQNTIKTAAQTFHKEMTKRVRAGVEIGVAVHATIQDNIEKYDNSFIDELQELTKVATYLKRHKQNKEAATLTGVANELVKEAQMGDWLKEKFNVPGWFGGWGKENMDAIKKMISQIDEYYQNAIINIQHGNPMQGVIDNLYNQATSKLNEIQRKAQGMKLKRQDAINLLQKIQTVIAATTNNPSMQTLQAGRRNISNIIVGVDQMDPMNIQERNPYAPSGPPAASTSQAPPAGGTGGPTDTPIATDRKGALTPLEKYLTDIKKGKGDAELAKEIDAIIRLLEIAKTKVSGGQQTAEAPTATPATSPNVPATGTNINTSPPAAPRRRKPVSKRPIDEP